MYRCVCVCVCVWCAFRVYVHYYFSIKSVLKEKKKSKTFLYNGRMCVNRAVGKKCRGKTTGGRRKRENSRPKDKQGRDPGDIMTGNREAYSRSAHSQLFRLPNPVCKPNLTRRSEQEDQRKFRATQPKRKTKNLVVGKPRMDSADKTSRVKWNRVRRSGS